MGVRVQSFRFQVSIGISGLMHGVERVWFMALIFRVQVLDLGFRIEGWGLRA